MPQVSIRYHCAIEWMYIPRSCIVPPKVSILSSQQNWIGIARGTRATDNSTTERERVNNANVAANGFRTPSEEHTSCTCEWCPHRPGWGHWSIIKHRIGQGQTSPAILICQLLVQDMLRDIQAISEGDPARFDFRCKKTSSGPATSCSSQSPQPRVVEPISLSFRKSTRTKEC